MHNGIYPYSDKYKINHTMNLPYSSSADNQYLRLRSLSVSSNGVSGSNPVLPGQYANCDIQVGPLYQGMNHGKLDCYSVQLGYDVFGNWIGIWLRQHKDQTNFTYSLEYTFYEYISEGIISTESLGTDQSKTFHILDYSKCYGKSNATSAYLSTESGVYNYPQIAWGIEMERVGDEPNIYLIELDNEYDAQNLTVSYLYTITNTPH
ncbi:hypothetical protein GF337_19410 [candidate division KSB1 bacterium]|nr:hypothetical protein [candidate division KSB1 bacterium]